MNIFSRELSKISPNNFGFFAVNEYIVCVAPYLKSTLPDKNSAFIDGYYEISNSQYHLAKEFLALCKKFGCGVVVEKEKSYKDFLYENGFFHKGKNTLLQDVQFGSLIYFTVFKVTSLPCAGEKFQDKFQSEEKMHEYFTSLGCDNKEIKELADRMIRLEFVKFLQVEKSKGGRYKS